MALTHDIDSAYADDAGDASVKAHQLDHDIIHRNLWHPPGRYPSRPYNQTMIWGGVSGHPYTTTGGTGSTFNVNDTSDFVLGDRSISITTNGTGQNTFVRRLSGTAMDFTNRVPRIWVKVTGKTRVNDLKLWLGSGGTLANAYQWQWTDSTPYWYAEGEWVAITLPWSEAVTVGTPNRAALTDVNFQVYDNNTGTGVTVKWGGFASVPDTTALWPNGVVSFTFDDAMDDHYTVAKAYMDKYGYAGTCYPIIDTLGTSGYMTLAQLKELVARSGWEVGLHAYAAANHNAVGGFPSLSASAQVKDIVQQREFLIANGFPNPANFAYPQGQFDVATCTNLAPWVDSARTTKAGNETWPPSDRMKMTTLAFSSSTTLATVQAAIDKAKANKEWLILLLHGIVASAPGTNDTTTAIFQGVVDYCNTQGVAVRTVGEVLRANPGS